jgi:serine/threonine-protein kinase
MGETKQRPSSTGGPLAGSPALGRGLDEDLEALLPGSVPELGAVIADKYRVERLIARGGMGAVYAATHLVSGKRVALKWMLPALGQIQGARERFIREACATARIDHPNIVDIYDVGDEGGSVYLVMEYLHGETLSERLERERIPIQEAIGLIIPALRGVAAAHSHDVIHRDLKPDNILLCRTTGGESLEPKVLDFGISKITGGDARNHSLTRSGAVLGTPYYMSPEQVRGARDVDRRTDVYAFGVMLYEIFTGQRPFDAETYNQLILKIVTDTPAPMATLNPAIDPRLVQIVEHAMARDPALRLPTIEALALALEPFSGGVRFRTSTTPLERSAPSIEVSPTLLEGALLAEQTEVTRAPSGAFSRARKRPLTTLASAVIALLLCSLGYWWLYVSHAEPARLAEPRRENRIAPAPQQPSAAKAHALDSLPTASSLSTPRVETTTNAAVMPASDSTASTAAHTRPASKARSERGERVSRKTPSTLPVRDKHASAAAAPPTPNRPPGDWDERMSNAPSSPTNAIPAGRIDQHDFR